MGGRWGDVCDGRGWVDGVGRRVWVLLVALLAWGQVDRPPLYQQRTFSLELLPTLAGSALLYGAASGVAAHTLLLLVWLTMGIPKMYHAHTLMVVVVVVVVVGSGSISSGNHGWMRGVSGLW